MSSSICTHFTQNAWKKDLCSNCFKSKDEHKQSSSSGSRFAGFSLRSNTANLAAKLSDNANKNSDYPNKHKTPAKSIIKVRTAAKPAGKRKAHKVSFPKHLAEVIGYGGEWSDADSEDDDDDDDDHDFMNLANDRDETAATSTDDEETIELKRITRANTDFNMNNGNLLGDPQENIKKSFAALKLGAPQVDKEGKKQTLKINVLPFGASPAPSAAASAIGASSSITSTTSASSKMPATITTTTTTTTTQLKTTVEKVENNKVTQPTKTVVTSLKKVTTPKSEQAPAKSSTLYSVKSEVVSSSDSSDGKNSPPIERAMEKSLMDEISETLEQQKQCESRKLETSAAAATTPTAAPKIKFEINSLSESLENKPFQDLKKPIARNPPITKDSAKPKINVFHKYSDSDSNASDGENGVSAYYDVVETQVSYENLPDGKYANCKDKLSENNATMSSSSSSTAAVTPSNNQTDPANKSMFSSSQYITDMLLSSKTRAASYNLHEGNFMTSKITSDGLIVTKCSSDDALDSTGSSFDGSSDEEASYNMTRSESDSGIGISIGSDYKNIVAEKERDRERMRVEKKLSVSTNNSDYEDIQVTDQVPVMAKAKNAAQNLPKPTAFALEKSRELHGEPDGSADPDGSLENKVSKTSTSSPLQSTQLPALPKSPPPTKLIDARPSFLHGLQKQQQHPPIALKKPELPAKPLVSPANTPLKTFFTKRPTHNMEQQQVINQLQLVMSKSTEDLNGDAAKDDAKLKKGRAPNPPPESKLSAPPTPERDYNVANEFAEKAKAMTADGKQLAIKPQTAEAKSTEVIDTAQAPTGPVRTEVDKSNIKSSAATHNNNNNNSTTTLATTIKPTSSLSPSAETSSTGTTSVTSPSIYTRKVPTVTSNTNSMLSANSHNSNNKSDNNNPSKNTASPVIREKDKRDRATVNPKFRSLNTFVMQRNNAAKNLQLQAATSSLSLKPMTPEPMPKSYKNQFSLSEECLAAAASSSSTKSSARPHAMSASTFNLANQGGDKHKTTLATTLMAPAPKTKTKFSIKKFLRMGGASKTTDNLNKKDAIYSEICTGDETNVSGKPRLVIIHPIDINTTAVEVVKDITKTNDAVNNAQTVAVVTAKPPAPPLRASDGQRVHELNKPARPPPPKSAELRRKQMISLSPTASIGSETSGSLKCKADNVYANLGEIRSAIAPRKPERTASMREREAQLELARQRHVGGSGHDCTDTISICSSNGDNVSSAEASHSQKASNNKTNAQQQHQRATNNVVDGKPPSGSVAANRTSTFERTTASKTDPKVMPIVNKLELFESRSNATTSNSNTNTLGSTTSATSSNDGRPSSLKDSVRKINCTIDSYLKDKREYENMYEYVKGPSSPPPPPARSMDFGAATAGQRLMQPRRNNLYSDTASIASYTRSEYGPVRNFGLNNSLANIPRVISASYCGSEAGEFDIYSPYSYYGSEAGGDVATDINDSVWGIPSAIKNRTKATNRLRMRKGRSVVHKNIEDNYTAVVVANHEALAQVLDQLQQTPIIPPALRPLANAINLRFEDFTIIDGAQAFVVGKKAFHAAVWTSAPVTLALSADCNQLAGVGGELNQLSGGVSGVLNPITEFCDLVPCYHLPLMPSTEVTMLQATISVLPRLQLETLQSIGAILKNKSQVLDKSNFNFRGSIPNLTVGGLKDNANGGNALRNVMSVQNLSTLNEENEKSTKTDAEQVANSGNAGAVAAAVATASGMPAFDDVMTREVAFIMLQLVNGMKNLQAKAIEEMPLSLSNVVLSRDVENKDAQARLCVLQGNHHEEDEAMGTLCRCAYLALNDMLPSTKITAILADILKQGRAESLSKAKSVLEFILWGPSDVVLTGATKERELALQRWLDLERATVLHGLVRTRVELTVYDECHLMFLVRSTSKMMNDAAKIVYAYQQLNVVAEQKD